MRLTLFLGAGVTAAVVALGVTALGHSSAREQPRNSAVRIIGSAPPTLRGQHIRLRLQNRLIAATHRAEAQGDGDGFAVVTIHGPIHCSTRRILARAPPALGSS